MEGQKFFATPEAARGLDMQNRRERNRRQLMSSLDIGPQSFIHTRSSLAMSDFLQSVGESSNVDAIAAGPGDGQDKSILLKASVLVLAALATFYFYKKYK